MIWTDTEADGTKLYRISHFVYEKAAIPVVDDFIVDTMLTLDSTNGINFMDTNKYTLIN